MAKDRLSMRKLKEVLRLKFDHQLTNRKIAKSCAISHVTVGKYLEMARQAGIRVMGPNSVGTINPSAHFDASLGRLNRVFLPRADIRVEDAEKVLGWKVMLTIPNEYTDVIASINKGVPLVKLLPRSPVAKAFARLAELVSIY